MKEHFLTLLRMRETDTAAFRTAASQLSALIAEEIAGRMHLESCSIRTPLAEAKGAKFTERAILIPILRSGVVLLPSFLDLFPNSAIGFFGIRRDEKTAIPHLYYENLPRIGGTDRVFLLDPMLATGGTANLALQLLAAKGASARLTTLVTFLASKEGFQSVQKRHPQVNIFTVAIDEKLNAEKFIIPGLGDFGNRYFGT